MIPPDAHPDDGGLYYAKGCEVWKRPITTPRPGGKSVILGFHACTASDVIGDEGAIALAAMLTMAERYEARSDAAEPMGCPLPGACACPAKPSPDDGGLRAPSHTEAPDDLVLLPMKGREVSLSQSPPVFVSNDEPGAEPSAALKPSDVLAKAADLIEPEGAWTQGTSYRDMFGSILDGGEPDVACRCAVGAVNEVCGWSWDAAVPAFHFLDRLLGADTARWNDAPGRSQAVVVAALRKASDLAREAGQ